jgi:long-chain acyl-CoA synthetase
MGDHKTNGAAHGAIEAPIEATQVLPAIAAEAEPAPAAAVQLSMAATYRGRHVMITGTTGFLGKVVASMLLHRHPDVAQLYVLVRGDKTRSARERFLDEIANSPVFHPLRDIYSDGFDDFLRDKITVLPGDVTQDNLGLSPQDAAPLYERLDLILNSAGLTDFSPSLEQAIGINTLGSLNVLGFARRCQKVALGHVSTCYVTGRRDGIIHEDEQPYGFYPRRDELNIDFSPERELVDCKMLIEQIYRQADDQERRALFVRKAREHLRDTGRDPYDADLLEVRVQEEKKRWIRNTLRDEGTRRADHWGWNNTYTYSKSLGEQLLTLHRQQLPLAIIRPAIVESALRYPTPGWNQGVNTCAPLTYIVWKGARFVPTRPGVRLDVVPVDDVASAMLMIGAALIARAHEYIYQIGTSDRNPLTVERAVELSALWGRQYYQRKQSGSKLQNLFMSAWEGVTVDEKQYQRFSAPGIRKIAGGVGGALRSFGKTGFPGVDNTLKGVQRVADQVEKQSALVERLFEVFMPFIHDSQFCFRAEAIRRLEARLVPEEHHLAFVPERLDWRYYWIKVQMPGLYRHVYPQMDELLKRSKKEVYTPQDLLEVFEGATQNHAQRIAFQYMTPEGVKRYTYAQLKERASWTAANLRGAGLAASDRVILMSEGRPAWGMCYFGILEAQMVAVPVDAELSLREVLNLVGSCRARGLIVSERVRERLEGEGLSEALAAVAAAQAVEVFSFDRLFTAPAQALALAPVGARGDEVASLIYTSGTTGTPKGVMLAHRNFTSLLTSVNQIFHVSEKDTFLSVLPLHHTFEFTAGFLLPLSRGATITYLHERSAEELSRAFQETRVTAMIGVPALWQLLHRRIMNDVAARGPLARAAFDGLVSFNRWLRDRFGVNWGHTLFAPVHKAFGGQIRYLISGGASLPVHIMETFHGLGFELLEGYGLTEAAPVLTCARPGRPMRLGTVGEPLPGVEIAIRDPDPTGVGEIVARAGNVMLGYYNNPDATAAVIDADGWLRTGDLGRLDSRGYLVISGRQKDVIVAANGENVYPDELEELYDGHPLMEELSIVGLSDGQGSERVACMVTPRRDDHLTREEVVAELRKHFDLKAARLPYHQRIKVLRFSDAPLPRTATRKIKRKEVQQMLEALEATAHHDAAPSQAEDWGNRGWLQSAIAALAGVEPAAVQRRMSLVDDLGFDSLAFTELSKAIEDRTGRRFLAEDLMGMATLDSLLLAVDAGPAAAHQIAAEDDGDFVAGFTHLPRQMRPQGARRAPDERAELRDIVNIPEPMRLGLKGALGAAQSMIYRDGFDVRVYGKAHIPFHENALVISNHCSHLDMGLVKYALRDWAPNLATLAASDYFFDTTAKRTYFGQLTNLIPVERAGSLETTMARVSEVVSQGNPLLLFPEGTRSTDGEIREFRPGLGYLALHNKVGVLPIYLSGTYRALPKGSLVPRKRRLKVHVGPMLTHQWLLAQTADMNPRDAYLEVARLAREAILALKAGRRYPDDGAAPRQDRAGEMIASLFASLPPRLQHDQVQEPVTYYFSLGEEDSGKWTLHVAPQGCRCAPGKPTGKADCVVKTTPEMFRKMITESYVPTMEEFMSGQIKTNNPALLIAFQHVFGF